MENYSTMRRSRRQKAARYAIRLCIVLLPFAAVAQDWEKIAMETDEPAFGEVIDRVSKGNQADAFGLKQGDYIFQLDTQSLRGFGLKRKSEEQTLFYVPKGGEITMQTLQPGKIGYNSSEIFRPWLAYLREQIGTRDEKWDDAVVEALVSLTTDPKSAVAQWEKVAAMGYPEDDLDGMVKARSDWLLGKPIRLDAFWKQINSVFEEIPAVYLGTLEDLALSSGNLTILRELQKADPASFQVEEVVLDEWEEVGKSDEPSPIRDIESVKKLHGKKVTGKLEVYGENNKSSRSSRAHLVGKSPSMVTPGLFIHRHAVLPDGMQDFHVTMEILAIGFENSSDLVNLIRMDVFRNPGEGEKYRRGPIGSIGVGREVGQEGAIYYMAGFSGKFREITHPEIKVPQKMVKFRNNQPNWSQLPKDPAKLSRPIRLDIVGFGKEAAVFANGVCYARVPRPEEESNLAIKFTITGMGMRVRDFNVFELTKTPEADSSEGN